MNAAPNGYASSISDHPIRLMVNLSSRESGGSFHAVI
jgi:hypothetical protein